MSEHIHLYKSLTSYKCVTASGVALKIVYHDSKTRTFIAKPAPKEKKKWWEFYKSKIDDRIWYRENGAEVNDNPELRIVAVESGDSMKCTYDFASAHLEKGGAAWVFTQTVKTFRIKNTFSKEGKRFVQEQEIFYSDEYNLPPSPEKRKDLVNKIHPDLRTLQWEVSLKEWEALR